MVSAVLVEQALWTHTSSLLSSACAPGAHYPCHRWYSLCNLHTPRAFTRPVCSWRTLLVPPLMQLVQSPHASSLYSTRVLLARTTRTAVVAVCAFYARLEPLLDPCAPGAHYSYRHWCSLCSLGTPRGLYSTRVLLAHTNRTAIDAACVIFARLDPLLDPCVPDVHYSYRRWRSLCTLRTPRAFTRPGFPARHELPCWCYSLCSLRTPRAFTRPGFPGRHELFRQCYNLCSDESTHDVSRSTILWLEAAPSSLEDVSPKVPGGCAILKRRLLTY